MKILERLRRCNYCRHDMTDEVSPDSYRQNPYCKNCADERKQAAIKARGEVTLKEVAGSLFLSPVQRTAS
jgi:hypothetical protein